MIVDKVSKPDDDIFCAKKKGAVPFTISGTVAVEKRQLGKSIRNMRKGDLLICTELSRLGRNMLMIMGILNRCSQKGLHLLRNMIKYQHCWLKAKVYQKLQKSTEFTAILCGNTCLKCKKYTKVKFLLNLMFNMPLMNTAYNS